MNYNKQIPSVLSITLAGHRQLDFSLIIDGLIPKFEGEFYIQIYLLKYKGYTFQRCAALYVLSNSKISTFYLIIYHFEDINYYIY